VNNSATIPDKKVFSFPLEKPDQNQSFFNKKAEENALEIDTIVKKNRAA